MSQGHPRQAGDIVFAALMPHAPILIPPVGRDELKSAAGSAAALQTAVGRLVGGHPDALTVISPHSPRRLGAFGAWSGNRLRVSFKRFGAPEAVVDLPNDLSFVAEFKLQARRLGLHTWEIPSQPLDHGALVPLWYLVAAGWTGPTAVLSLNYPGEAG